MLSLYIILRLIPEGLQYKSNGRSHNGENPTDLTEKYLISLYFKGIINLCKR